MSGKLVIAVILALQVSVSLCELPGPDQELVEKYEGLRKSFYARLAQLYAKTKDAIGPMTETLPQTQVAKEYVEGLQEKPHVQSAVKIITGVAGELAPLVDKARTATLGLYGQYVRPWAGPHLDQAITNIKAYLDSVLPLEEA